MPGLIGVTVTTCLRIRHDLDVDVGRLQRKAVVVIEEVQVQTMGLAFPEFDDRPEAPQPGDQVNVATGGGATTGILASVSVRTVYLSTTACALAVKVSTLVR